MSVSFTKAFRRQYQKAPLTIQKQFAKRLELFLQNPNNATLRKHRLSGQLNGYFSININGDWRALFSVLNDDDGAGRVVFEALGTHSQLYK